MKNKTSLLILITIVILSSCSNIRKNSFIGVKYKDSNWNKSIKSNTNKYDEILAKADNYDFIYSVLIAQHDSLLIEKYYNGASDTVAFNIKSVTKSITSGLVGIAIDKGIIEDIDLKLIDLLPEYFQNQEHKDKAEITIRELLTMRAGYGFHSTRDIFETDDWIENILNYKLDFSPGEQFCYAACESHLLSAIITKVSNMSTEEFARKYLMDSLNIKIAKWKKDPKNINNGNADLYMTSRDLLTYGQLFLNKGIYDGEQLISSDWINKSITVSNSNLTRCEDSKIIPFSGFGYHWWLENLNNHKAVIASGFGGNFIIIIPDLDLTIVTNANTNVSWQENGENVKKILNLIVELIKTIE